MATKTKTVRKPKPGATNNVARRNRVVAKPMPRAELHRRATAPSMPGTFTGKNPRVQGNGEGLPVVRPGKDDAARLAQSRKVLAADAQKAAREALASDLASGRKGPVAIGKAGLSELTATQLGAACKALNERAVTAGRTAPYKGYSGLKKDELVEYLVSGTKPAPAPTSTQALRAEAAGLKKAGKLTGAISAAKVDVLRKAVAAAKTADTPVEVARSTPNKGTVEWYKSQLRAKAGVDKGYGEYAEIAKAGGLGSISSMKAETLKAFCKSQGIVG